MVLPSIRGVSLYRYDIYGSNDRLTAYWFLHVSSSALLQFGLRTMTLLISTTQAGISVFILISNSS